MSVETVHRRRDALDAPTGRVRGPAKLSVVMALRVSFDEASALRLAAQAAGESPSEFLRKHLLLLLSRRS